MRYVVELSYLATNKFSGWQKQTNAPTFQGELECIFSKILGEKISLCASGRTDAGVSAIKQVAHFDYNGKLDKNFVGHVNSMLPKEIRVLSVQQANEDFHARFSAKQKTYKYFFYVSKISIPYYDQFASQVKCCIDDNVLFAELNKILGEHDFTSFCASGSEVKDFVREIYSASIKKEGELYSLSITGNGFLYNMVRIIVGTLIDLARGGLTGDITQIINKKDRKFAGKTAPAKGLVLADVSYI